MPAGPHIELARDGLVQHGLPWLGQFQTRDDVVRRFLSDGPIVIGMTAAGGLDIAELLAAVGREDEARAVLEAYVAAPVLRSHAGYLADYVPRIGHPDLVDRISIRD